jgi:hypothetical protein
MGTALSSLFSRTKTRCIIQVEMVMTVTYKSLLSFPGLKIAVLHKVVYSNTVDDLPAYTQNSYKDYLVKKWCKENCKHRFYVNTSNHTTEKFVEFEDDREAFLFKLKFS